MRTIEKIIKNDQALPGIFKQYFSDLSFCVLDIETCGLSPLYSPVILIGGIVSRPDASESKFFQFFAESPEEEREILSSSIDAFKDVDFFITYNGRRFDIPFLNKRSSKYDLSFPKAFNMDLYHLIKYYSPISSFSSSLSQTAMEIYAGIGDKRKDQIDGKISVSLYECFRETASTSAFEKILLHNSDDVRQLFRLISLTEKCDLHRALYTSGFPFPGGYVSKIICKDRALYINGVTYTPKDFISFPDFDRLYTLRISGSGNFEVVVPCYEKGGYLFFDMEKIAGHLKGHTQTLPGSESGYLIVKNRDRLNYTSINFFFIEFLPYLLAV